MGAAVVYDFNPTYGTDSLEKLFEVAFCRIVREVSYIHPPVFHGCGITTALTVTASLTLVASLFAGMLIRGTRLLGPGVASFVAARFLGGFGFLMVGTALWAWRSDGILATEAESFEEFLPPAQLGSGHGAAL
jgi:hypothetical protein